MGDVVKWIGFPGASLPPEKTGPSCVGIVVTLHHFGIKGDDVRADVSWGDGSFGNMLYPQTIEVVSEID